MASEEEWIAKTHIGLSRVGTIYGQASFLYTDRLHRVCSLLERKGYMADVIRHGQDASGGVMETIIYKTFQVFKKEDVEFGSLGVAPLAGLGENSANLVERLLCFVHEHLNECYGFRDLSRAKEKYSPTQWLPSYYVYLSIIPTPEMFYIVARVQNPQKIWGWIHFL